MSDLQNQLHQVRQALRSLSNDASEAMAAVGAAQRALSDADVAYCMLQGDAQAYRDAQAHLAVVKQDAEVYARRRAALVDAEDRLQRDIAAETAAIRKEQRERVTAALRPQMADLGDAFLQAGVAYAAAFSEVNDIPPHLIDPGRLLAKLSLEQPLPAMVAAKIQEYRQ